LYFNKKNIGQYYILETTNRKPEGVHDYKATFSCEHPMALDVEPLSEIM
jgi:hypothetical protein